MTDNGSQGPETELERRHREACEQGRKFYIDPATGYEVRTQFFLLQRGHCCQCGCRHCPYGFKKEQKS